MSLLGWVFFGMEGVPPWDYICTGFKRWGACFVWYRGSRKLIQTRRQGERPRVNLFKRWKTRESPRNTNWAGLLTHSQALLHPLQVHSYGNRETATAVSHRPRRRLVSRRRHCATPPRTAGRRCGLDGELSRRFHRSRSGPTGRGGLGRMKPMRTRDHGAAEVFDEMPPRLGWGVSPSQSGALQRRSDSGRHPGRCCSAGAGPLTPLSHSCVPTTHRPTCRLRTPCGWSTSTPGSHSAHSCSSSLRSVPHHWFDAMLPSAIVQST